MNAVASADFAQIEPGFADPVHAAQACFRAILDAMARPGHIVQIPALLAGAPATPLGLAATAVALTLCDHDTPVWLDDAAAGAANYLAFHCGARLAASPAQAQFAFIRDLAALPALDAFSLGTDEYPDRSATVIIEVGGLTNSAGAVLRGPGIRDEIHLGVAGLPVRVWSERAALAELFPRGIDLLFVSDNALAAVPRSTVVTL